ncbi:translationally controlled tumor-associated [Trametes coccinea BRFM310]|uniref:Translationally-controlled tumor protein homolog n=1 Tax=Trametes coccinea (strain BRFM310) TaxID=1353009 RepID=A0A1Y2ISZ5_TRAC3|nr:translationally controlled tumor-associated [Trametes coccinea BRFM310]
MKLFTDVISNDEMFSDAFPIKEVDDIVYEVDCQMITVKPGADVDIGNRVALTSLDTGANPSSEEQEEAVEDGAQTVNNVVYSFRLQSTQFDKKSYLTYLKGYMKAVKQHLQEHNPDRVEAFEKGAQAFAKKLVANFKDYEFYTGENMNPDGMVALLNYREDGVTPYFTFWKDGLKEVKL